MERHSDFTAQERLDSTLGYTVEYCQESKQAWCMFVNATLVVLQRSSVNYLADDFFTSHYL